MGVRYPYDGSAIHGAGFDAVELAISDLLAYGQVLNGKQPDASNYNTVAEIAKAVNSLAQKVGIGISMLWPFTKFEGWKLGYQDDERENAFVRAGGWLRIMEALRTDMLQVVASNAEGISHSVDDIAGDLATLADIYAEKGFRVAYENCC